MNTLRFRLGTHLFARSPTQDAKLLLTEAGFMLVVQSGFYPGIGVQDFVSDLVSSAGRFLNDKEAYPPLQRFPYVAARAWLKCHWSAHRVEREFAFEQMHDGHGRNTENRWKALARAMFQVRRGHLNVRQWTSTHAIEPDTTTEHAELVLKTRLPRSWKSTRSSARCLTCKTLKELWWRPS